MFGVGCSSTKQPAPPARIFRVLVSCLDDGIARGHELAHIPREPEEVYAVPDAQVSSPRLNASSTGTSSKRLRSMPLLINAGWTVRKAFYTLRIPPV